jgi:hypothetical protein
MTACKASNVRSKFVALLLMMQILILCIPTYSNANTDMIMSQDIDDHSEFIGVIAQTPGIGEFRVANYGTGSDTNYRYYRGYVFQVTEETKVTALIGGGNGGVFAGAIYTIQERGDNGIIIPKKLLGSVAFAGTEPEQVVQLPLDKIVTLQPGIDYLIASGLHYVDAEKGEGVYGYAIENINVSDLEASTRVKEGIMPPVVKTIFSVF